MEYLIHLLSQYKYIILFPLAIVEGPIVAVVAGFLCTNKLLNLALVYPIIILGDITGDSLCYLLGRFGVPKFFKKIAKKFGASPEKMARVKSYFDTNPIKTISLSKITLGIGVAGIYLAGNAKIPYSKFISVCIVTSAVQYVFYLAIGLLFGSAYLQISRYLDVASAAIIITTLTAILFFIIKSKLKKSPDTIS